MFILRIVSNVPLLLYFTRKQIWQINHCRVMKEKMICHDTTSIERSHLYTLKKDVDALKRP